MEAKAKEFDEVLQEQYYPWFAQYMVMKRYNALLFPFFLHQSPDLKDLITCLSWQGKH
jgi:hypothetical protein